MRRMLWLLLVVGLLAPGCMPDRRDNTGASGTQPDTGSTEQDVASADTTADVSGDTGGGGGDVEPVPEGCTSDDDCKDFDPPDCQQVACDLGSGLCKVSASADGTPCGTGDPCLLEPTCKAGACVGKPKDCADDNPCTTEFCQAGTGCVIDNNKDACDDGDACTSNDQCSGGACKGSPKVCEGAKPPCIIAECDKETGCKVFPADLAGGATVSCDDGQVCTENDACKGGTCKGTLKTCEEDDNPCTVGSCQPTNGACVTGPIGLPLFCDDGDACTVETACDGTDCVGKAKNCDDDNACTTDSCDKAKGCQHAFAELGASATPTCDDGDPCTAGEICASGSCVGKPTNCDDGNACTNDACEAGFGCVGKSNLSSCSDGDPCTENDACSKGTCSGSAVTCDDNNPCTNDSCGTDGCTYVAKTNASACGADSQCWAGVCVTPKCGNGTCEYNETSGNCLEDCPEGGGLCAVDDESCITACNDKQCLDEQTACSQETGCVDLASCVSVCDDEACRVGCLGKAPPKAVKVWRDAENCLSAKCLKNSWAGKNCKLGQISGSFPACVGACQEAVCYTELQTCYAKVGCQGIDYCVNQCTDGSSACVKACFQYGTGEEIELFDQLTLCMNLKCL